MNVLIFVVLAVADASNFFWIWTDPEFKPRDLNTITRQIMLGHELAQYSYIHLGTIGRSLWIHSVRKSERTWPKNTSFCSFVLGGTITQFTILNDMDISTDIDNIRVSNISETPYISCRCYVGVFRKMGFNQVNGKIIDSDEKLTKFCSNSNNRRIIASVPKGEIPGKVIPLSDEALVAALDASYVVPR